jgi:hypothetical protein
MSVHQNFPSLERLPSYPIWGLLVVSLALPTILNFLVEVRLEFSDYDTLIYTLIGKGIFSHGKLPPSYIFDHKPALSYLFYAPLAFIQIEANRYAFLSALFYTLIGWSTHRLLLRGSKPFWLVLLAVTSAGLGNVGFSGNTEVIFVLFQLIAVGVLTTVRGDRRSLLLSSLSAVIAVNINYTAAVSLAPAVLFCLYSRSRCPAHFVRLAVGYATACLLIFALLLLAFISLGGDAASYVLLQYRYLSGYGETRTFPSPVFLITVAAPLATSVLLLLPAFQPKPMYRNLAIALTIMMWFSAISFVLSGKFFMHYIYALLAPASVLILTLDFTLAHTRVLLASMLFPFGVYETTKAAVLNWQAPSDTASSIYAALKAEVQGEQVATMGSSVVPFFFSDAEPFHPFVWIDHARIIFGPEEDKFHVDQLLRRPSFVLTGPDTCRTPLDLPDACGLLESAYEEADLSLDKPYYNADFGFRLYKLKGSSA